MLVLPDDRIFLVVGRLKGAMSFICITRRKNTFEVITKHCTVQRIEQSKLETNFHLIPENICFRGTGEGILQYQGTSNTTFIDHTIGLN